MKKTHFKKIPGIWPWGNGFYSGRRTLAPPLGYLSKAMFGRYKLGNSGREKYPLGGVPIKSGCLGTDGNPSPGYRVKIENRSDYGF